MGTPRNEATAQTCSQRKGSKPKQKGWVGRTASEFAVELIIYVYSHIAASGWIITQHTQHYTLHNTIHIIHYKELLNTATPPSHTPHVISLHEQLLRIHQETKETSGTLGSEATGRAGS